MTNPLDDLFGNLAKESKKIQAQNKGKKNNVVGIRESVYEKKPQVPMLLSQNWDYIGYTLMVTECVCKSCGSVHQSPISHLMKVRKHRTKPATVYKEVKTMVDDLPRSLDIKQVFVEYCQDCFLEAETDA